MKDKKILISYSNTQIRDIIVMMIESEFDYQILESDLDEEVLNNLHSNEELSLLILSIQNDIAPYLEFKEKNKSLNIPIYLLDSEELKQNESIVKDAEKCSLTKIIPLPFDHIELTDSISKLFLKNAKNEDEKSKATPFSSNSDYYRIKSKRLKLFNNIKSDIYIKISEEKFVKVFKSHDEINMEKIEDYQEKGIDYFYLDKKQFDESLLDLVKDLSDQLTNKELDRKEITALQITSIQEIQNVVKNIGIKEAVIKLTESVTTSVKNILSKDKKLASILDMVNDQDPYFFQLSNITNYLSVAICKEMDLTSEKEVSKFVLASMICDLKLSDPQNEMILDKDSINNSKNVDKNKVMFHGEEAAKMIQEKNDSNVDVERIVTSHHERPDGSGYPKGLNSTQISPHAAIFILAYNFAYHLIQSGCPEGINSKMILQKLDSKYSSGNFKRPYEALLSSLDLDN